jgi:hypothetical protein
MKWTQICMESSWRDQDPDHLGDCRKKNGSWTAPQRMIADPGPYA